MNSTRRNILNKIIRTSIVNHYVNSFNDNRNNMLKTWKDIKEIINIYNNGARKTNFLSNGSTTVKEMQVLLKRSITISLQLEQEVKRNFSELKLHLVIIFANVLDANLNKHQQQMMKFVHSSVPNKQGVLIRWGSEGGGGSWKILQNEVGEGVGINGDYIFVYFDPID